MTAEHDASQDSFGSLSKLMERRTSTGAQADDDDTNSSVRSRDAVAPFEDDDESSALSVRGWAPTRVTDSNDDDDNDDDVEEDASGEPDSPVLPATASAASAASTFAEDDDETSEMPVRQPF